MLPQTQVIMVPTTYLMPQGMTQALPAPVLQGTHMLGHHRMMQPHLLPQQRFSAQPVIPPVQTAIPQVMKATTIPEAFPPQILVQQPVVPVASEVMPPHQIPRAMAVVRGSLPTPDPVQAMPMAVSAVAIAGPMPSGTMAMEEGLSSSEGPLQEDVKDILQPEKALVPEERLPSEDGLAEEEGMPPLEDGEKLVFVLVLTGLKIDADLGALAQRAADTVGMKVVKYLAVWNKNTLLMELSEPVSVLPRVLMDGGMVLGPSPIDRLDLAAPSRTLNVRTFVMDPQHDFEGTAQEIAAHEQATRNWKCHRRGDVKEIQQLVESVGGSTCCLIVPKKPRLISWLEPQRCYTQLLFKYADIESCTRAQERIEALQGRVGGLRVTLRTEYSKPVS